MSNFSNTVTFQELLEEIDEDGSGEIEFGEFCQVRPNLCRVVIDYSYNTGCPRSSDPFYIVTYYIIWVTTSWTDGMMSIISINSFILVLITVVNLGS